MEYQFRTVINDNKYVDIYNLGYLLQVKESLIFNTVTTAVINWTIDIDAGSYGISSIIPIIQKIAVEIEYEYYKDEAAEDNDDPTFGTHTITGDYEIITDEFNIKNGQLILSNIEVDLKHKTITLSN